MEIKYEIKNGELIINGEIFELENMTFIKELGAGANAIAFLAKNTVTEREECVKIWTYTDKYGDNEAKFRNEVEKNSKFTDLPNVATIYRGDVKTMDEFNVCYCVLEYVKGINLEEYLKTEPGLIFRYNILDKILSTMKEIYIRGFYHGDLHVKNIIISDNDEMNPCIIDFGTSFFSGKKASHKRDAEKLYDLCMDVMPELMELPFIIKRDIFIEREDVSERLCDYMLDLLNFWWEFYDLENKNIDDYYIKSLCFRAVIFNNNYKEIQDKKNELIKFFSDRFDKKIIEKYFSMF